MSAQKKTIRDIRDVVITFIRDEKADVSVQYQTYGTSYVFTRRGLADFPYILEVTSFGPMSGMIMMYRGTNPGLHDKRVLFKTVLISKDKDNRKNVFDMRCLVEMARLRANKKIYLTNNTDILCEKLQELTNNSR